MLLNGIQMRPHRVSLGGALGGLLQTAGRDLPQTYLMGTTGLAFRLTLDLVLSPGSPWELNFHEVLPLWENLGAWFKRVSTRPENPEYGADRAEALRLMYTSIDQGRPAIAYDLLAVPEYGLVVGYDETRLACLTLGGETVLEWMDAAVWPPPSHQSYTRAEAIALLDLAPDFDRRRAEVASLRFAVAHFWSPPSRDQWVQNGSAAYQYWMALLNAPGGLHGAEPGLGHSYNLLLLQRARRDAAAYLSDLASRYPAVAALPVAAARYGEVAAALEAATTVLPFPGGALLTDQHVRFRLSEHLRTALAAERQGVDALEAALRSLR